MLLSFKNKPASRAFPLSISLAQATQTTNIMNIISAIALLFNLKFDWKQTCAARVRHRILHIKRKFTLLH